MEELTSSPNRIAFRCALIYTIYSIVLTYVLYFMGIDPEMKNAGTGVKLLTSLLSYAPLLALIFYAQRFHRDQELGGVISFGRAFSTGFRLSMFAGLLLGVFMVVYYKILNTAAYDQLMAASEAQMLDQDNMDDEKVETAIGMMHKWFPFILFIGTIIGFAIVGSIISLIGAAIFKRDAQLPLDTLAD